MDWRMVTLTKSYPQIKEIYINMCLYEWDKIDVYSVEIREKQIYMSFFLLLPTFVVFGFTALMCSDGQIPHTHKSHQFISFFFSLVLCLEHYFSKLRRIEAHKNLSLFKSISTSNLWMILDLLSSFLLWQWERDRERIACDVRKRYSHFPVRIWKLCFRFGSSCSSDRIFFIRRIPNPVAQMQTRISHESRNRQKFVCDDFNRTFLCYTN